MLRRLIFPVILGLAGCAILIALGTWQVQRQLWKNDILAVIEAGIAAEPVPLPSEGQGEIYLPVAVSGELTGEYLRVLVSRKQIGPGHRIIAVLDMGGRRVLTDLGFIRDGAPLPPVTGQHTFTANLHRPSEVDAYTPAPDRAANLWFARDVAAMAAELKTEATFVVARETVVPGIEAMPLDTSGIPNDHLQYAVTWFLLATVWAGMTGLLIWRISQRRS
jgi:surfeit locus 1 family protein